MQKIRVELTDLAPEATDHLIALLHTYLTTESADILLEVQDMGKRSIPLPDGNGGMLRIPYDQIRYVTSNGHRTAFVLIAGIRQFRITFSEISALLPSDEFLDCSRGILLNMQHIASAQRDSFIMDDGASFPIRRNGRREILRRYEELRLLRRENGSQCAEQQRSMPPLR